MAHDPRRVSDGKLSILREMVRDHLVRVGERKSFSLNPELLLGMILELEQRRAAMAAEAGESV